MGETTYQLVQDFFQQYHAIDTGYLFARVFCLWGKKDVMPMQNRYDLNWRWWFHYVSFFVYSFRRFEETVHCELSILSTDFEPPASEFYPPWFHMIILDDSEPPFNEVSSWGDYLDHWPVGCSKRREVKENNLDLTWEGIVPKWWQLKQWRISKQWYQVSKAHEYFEMRVLEHHTIHSGADTL